MTSEIRNYALALAAKGVQINDGYTYRVHAADIVNYNETIRALIEELDILSSDMTMTTENNNDVREALAQAISNSFFAMEAGEEWFDGGYSKPKISSGSMQLAADILSRFEVRPRGTVPAPQISDAEVERDAILADLREWSRPLGSSPIEEALALVIARIENRKAI